LPSTILCIDDDRKVLDELDASLGDDTALIHCSDLDEAFEIVVLEEPDLVLLEIKLASGNGLDFAERVRSQGGGAATTPIVVVTSAGRTPSLYGRAVQLGVGDYLTKPVSASQLVGCVRDQLTRKRESPADANEDSGFQVGIGSGKLADLPFPELLDRVHRRGETGVLIVGNASERIGLQIRNGSPTAVTQPRSENVDDYLVRSGRLSAQDRERALNEAALGVSGIEEILVGMGVLDERELEEALREQAEEVVLELFELAGGRYRFEPRRRLKGARSLDITRSAHSLIVRGILAWMPVERVRSSLARYRDLYVVAAGNPERLADDVPFSDAQRDFVAGLVGDRTVGDFRGASEFEQRTLYAFAILGAIDLSPDPLLVLDDALSEGKAEKGGAKAERKAARKVARKVERKVERREASADDLEGELLLDQVLPEEVAPAPQPVADFSHEDDLFDQQAFEEDSFENEMVAESATAGESDPLIDIDRLVSAQLESPAKAVPVPRPETKAARRPLVEPPKPVEPPLPEVAAEHAEKAPERAEVEQADARPEPAEGRRARKARKVKPKKVKRSAKPEVAPPTPVGEPQTVAADEGAAPEKRRKQAARSEAPDEKPLAAAAVERAEPAPTREPEARVEPPKPVEVEVERPEEPQRRAPEPLAAQPSVSDRVTGVAPPRKYEIAPIGRVEMSEHDRLVIAARVRKRVDRKYQHLLDRRREKQVAAAVVEGAPEAEGTAASRALEAESWFRKGRDLLKTKKYDKAAEAFGMSAHLDPTEGEYVAHLGYTLYLLKPNDETVRKEALEDIARGIKLSPDRELAYVYLGRIFKVKGDLENAEKMFRRALKIRPHCREAAQELRLIEMREQQKKTGFLGRLLK
jgi:CheY-like chemotaxis protein/tetratricopeptide (TPR) repeat protein